MSDTTTPVELRRQADAMEHDANHQARPTARRALERAAARLRARADELDGGGQ